MSTHEMRCYQLKAFGGSVEETRLAVPVPQGTEVLLKVAGTGICHSDLHICEGHFDLGSGRTLPFSGLNLPLTLGHEVSGEVAALGPEAAGVAIGDKVLAFSWIGCGDCDRCRSGNEHLCSRGRCLGLNRDGGYAEYLLVPHSRYLVDLGSIDPVAAAPLGCSGLTTYSALKKFGSAVKTSPTVVIGAGGLGLMAVCLLRMLKAPAPVVVEIDEGRREAALAAGAGAAVDPRSANAAKQVKQAVGQPIRSVLDVVGSGATASFGLDLLSIDARLVVVGLMGGDMTLSVPMLPLKSTVMQGSYLGSLAELRELLDLVRENGLPPVPLDRRPLASAPESLEKLRQGKVVGRVVLVP